MEERSVNIIASMVIEVVTGFVMKLIKAKFIQSLHQSQNSLFVLH